MVCTCR